MPRIPNLRRAFRFPWRGAAQTAREVDDELAFHLDMRAAELVAGGMAPDEARREARRQFGDLEYTRRYCEAQGARRERATRRTEYVAELRQDARYALRQLGRARSFALGAIGTLALGIGATTAIFSVVNAVLLRPLPFAEPDRLVQAFVSSPSLGLPPGGLSAPEFLDIAASRRSLAAVGAFVETDLTVSGNGTPERVRAAAATASLFRVLGVGAAVGRVFAAEEDRPGAGPVVVLGDALWRRRFGADPAVVGRTVRFDGVPRVVVGVLPRGFYVGDVVAFVPLALDPANPRPRGAHYLSVVGRLAAGATLETARAELEAYAKRSVRDYREQYADLRMGMVVRPLRDAWVGDVRGTILVLFGAVALLLLLACANVANLLLVRAEGRQREMGVRVALGAGRGRLVRQLLTESLLLAVAGGVLGVALAVWGVRAVVALEPQSLPAGVAVSVDGTVLVVAATLTLLTGLLFGLAPALQASGAALHATIVAGSVGASRGGARGRLRSSLVAAEMALAAVVLVGAGLVGRSFWQLTRVDPGFAREKVLAVDVKLPAARYPDVARVPATFGQILERVRTIPGVRSAAVTSDVPFSGRGGDWVVEVEGRAPSPAGPLASPTFLIVSADYFRTMGIPLEAGRAFTTDDERTPPVVVVSRAMGRTFWPGRDPVGKRVRLGTGRAEFSFPWMEVIGVVGDVRSQELAAETRPTYYLLDAQFPSMVGGAQRSMTLLVRTAGDPLQLVAPVRRAVWALDGELAASNVRTLGDVIAGSVARPRFAAAVLAVFGTAALALAVIGVYAVLSYAVTRRRREMGIRMALGAGAADLRRLVVGQGMRVAVAGLAVGLAAALAGSRVLSSLLFGVSATDPTTFAAAALVLGAAATVACWVPARRASRLNPAAVLRAE